FLLYASLSTFVLFISFLFFCCFFCVFFFFFFFFQAEDGIRDGHVTGVQTCALPISPCFPPPRGPTSPLRRAGSGRSCDSRGSHRSEERRVGKECRSRWAPEQ